MAEIIPLEHRRRRTAAAAAPTGRPAAIVIFPGVRYEKRRDEPSAAPASPRRRVSKAVDRV